MNLTKITYINTAIFPILYIGVSSVFPLLNGYLGNIDIILCIIFNLMLISLSIKYKTICFVNKKHFYFTIIIIFFTLIFPFLLKNGIWAKRYLSLLFFISGPLIFRLFYKKNKIKVLKKISYIIIFFSFITGIFTTINLIKNPYISRSIKSFGEKSVILKQNMIGGYEYIYFCLIIGILFFYLFLKNKKFFYLIISSFMLVICLLSNYLTALLLFFLGNVISLYIVKFNKNKVIFYLTFLFIISILDKLLKMIIYLFPNGRINRLFSNIDKNIYLVIFYEFIRDRIPTLKKGVDGLIESKFLSIYFLDSLYSFDLLSHHSHILDSIIIMGIPLSIIYFYIIFKPIQYNISSVVIVVIILSLINNLTPSIAIALYIIVPTLNITNNIKK